MSKLSGREFGTLSVDGPNGKLSVVNPSADIAIDQDLNSEMADQPGLYAWYASISERAMHKMKRLKYQILCLQEDLDHAIRSRGAKLTEKAIEREISRNPKMRMLYQKYIDAKYEHGQWHALTRAFDQRAGMLQSLGANLRSEGGEVRLLTQAAKKIHEGLNSRKRKGEQDE